MNSSSAGWGVASGEVKGSIIHCIMVANQQSLQVVSHQMAWLTSTLFWNARACAMGTSHVLQHNLSLRQPGCMLHEAGYSHTGANAYMYTLIHMCCVLSRMDHSAVVCVEFLPAPANVSAEFRHCVWQMCDDTNSRSVWTSLLLGTKMNNVPVCACAYPNVPQRNPN